MINNKDDFEFGTMSVDYIMQRDCILPVVATFEMWEDLMESRLSCREIGTFSFLCFSKRRLIEFHCEC